MNTDRTFKNASAAVAGLGFLLLIAACHLVPTYQGIALLFLAYLMMTGAWVLAMIR